MSRTRLRSSEQMLWIAAYTIIAMGPVSLVAVAVKPGAQGGTVVFAAGLGFAALSMMILQSLVSGRWAAITRSFGLRSVLSLHRQAGMVVLILVVAHVVVLMADDPSRLGLLDQRTAPLRARAGLAAVIALAALTVASLWRGRLSYERWRGLHVVAAVVAIAGTFIHLIGVSAYVSLPAIRWAVLVLVLLGVGAVFCVRVARPYAMSRRPFRVKAVGRERGGALTLDVEADGHGGLAFEPGQFAWLKVGARPYGMDEHPFTVSSAAGRGRGSSFTIKAIGDFTEGIADLRPGTHLLIDGPHGEEAGDGPDVHGRLLLAAGIGITPAVSVLRTAAERGDDRPALLIYGSRRWEDVILREEIEELERRLASLRVVHVLSRPHEGWEGERGRIDEDLLRRVVPAEALRWSALTCGPPQMVAGAAAALRRLGMPPTSIQSEGFG